MTTGLPCSTRKLTDAHKRLIEILARAAVDEFLSETESDEAVQKNDELHEDMA